MGFMDKLKEKAENVRDKAVDFAEEKQLANKLGPWLCLQFRSVGPMSVFCTPHSVDRRSSTAAGLTKAILHVSFSGLSTGP